MKYLSFQRILFVLLFFVLFIIISCDKEDDFIDKNKFYYYNLTPEQIAQSPYFINNKYDTLSFFNTKGDTFTFRKIKTDTSFREEASHHGNGLTDIYMYQYLHNTYQTLKGDGRFEVWHKTNSIGNYIEINLNNFQFNYTPELLGKSHESYLEKYEILGTVFNNVTRFNRTGGFLVYINQGEGLVTFISNQNTDTLVLLKK